MRTSYLRGRRTLCAPLILSDAVFGSPRRTRIGKEEREGLLLEALRKSGSLDLPSGPVRRGEVHGGKGPDFLMGAPPDGPVSIEVTELYLEDERTAGEGSLLRQQESLRDTFLCVAENAFYESGLSELAANVTFSWSPDRVKEAELTPKRVRKLAPVTVEIVTTNLARSEGALVRIDEEYLRQTPLSGVLTAIHAREVQPYPDGRASPWCSSGPSFLPTPLGIAAVERAIAIKEMKLAAYRKQAEKAWLLLAAMGGPSSYDGVDDAVLAHRFRSAFDRVILFCPSAVPERRVLALVGM